MDLFVAACMLAIVFVAAIFIISLVFENYIDPKDYSNDAVKRYMIERMKKEMKDHKKGAKL